MSSVYSKPIQYELNPEATHISASQLNQLDVDLIDKIKVAITKLKTKNNEQVGKKKDLQNSLVLCVIKIAMKINKQFFAIVVPAGFIENAMVQQKLSMRI